MMYYTFSYYDASYSADMIIRFLGIACVFVYLFFPLRFLFQTMEWKLTTNSKGKITVPIIIVLVAGAIWIVLVSWCTGEINDHLLSNNYKRADAYVSYCYYMDGNEYCVYNFFGGDREYEIGFLNADDDEKYKPDDKFTVIYYPPNPCISKIE